MAKEENIIFCEATDNTARLSKSLTKIALREFRKMAKWSIKRMFENHYDSELTVSIGELEKELDYAWRELKEEGYIITAED